MLNRKTKRSLALALRVRKWMRHVGIKHFSVTKGKRIGVPCIVVVIPYKDRLYKDTQTPRPSMVAKWADINSGWFSAETVNDDIRYEVGITVDEQTFKYMEGDHYL